MNEMKMEPVRTDYAVRILGSLNMLLYYLTRPMFYIMSLRRKRFTPPIDDDVLLQSAKTLARKIRNGELKSEDVIKSYIKRIQNVNPVINAVVDVRFSEAFEEAKKVDELVASKVKSVEDLERELPLLGVPLSVKESCAVKGKSLTSGSIPRREMKADADGEFVSLMKKSGAIPVVVSNTPEFCLNWESWNMVTGRTRNPYDTNRTPGGSSGGEGALIASAASIIGIGSDLAGSIRVPAMFNGIFGHKPTGGLCPLKGHYPLMDDPVIQRSLTIGPMARYAEDLKGVLKIGTGNPEHLRLDEEVDISKLTIFATESFDRAFMSLPVEPDIKRAVRKSVEYLKTERGCNTGTIDFIDLKHSYEIGTGILLSFSDPPKVLEDPQNPKKNVVLHMEILKALLRLSVFTLPALCFQTFLNVSMLIPAEKKKKIQDYKQAAIHTIKERLGDNGVIICPTFPTPAFVHNQSIFKISGANYAMLSNVLELPATHVPTGLDRNGLPVGVQVIAAPNQDRLCLAVAEELERAFGGWVRPPDTSVHTN